MIAWDLTERNAAAETACGFIGTTAALIMAGTAAATAGASVYSAKKQSSTAKAAAQYQQQQANYAAELEAKSAQAALDFAKQQEAERKAEWEKTQARNFEIYQSDLARDDERYTARVARLQPFTNTGYGAIGQLARPLPTSDAGTLGDIINGGRR